MQLNEPLRITIGRDLKLHRIRKGLTLDELSVRSGVSKTSLSQIERGGWSPSLDKLEPICQALEVTLSVIAGGCA